MIADLFDWVAGMSNLQCVLILAGLCLVVMGWCWWDDRKMVDR